MDAYTLDPAGTAFVYRPNVEDVIISSQDSGYLVGYLAALMEKKRVGKATHGVIGVMGGIPEPQVNSYIDGYKQGAHAAYPRVKIRVDYSYNFIDQGQARAIGLSQIAHGADILFGVAGDASLGYMEAARDRGVYAIGVDEDRSSLGQFVLTSAVKHLDTAVYFAIMDAARNHFLGGIRPVGLAEGGTSIGKPSRLVPPSILTSVEAQARKIAKGEITIQP
jgi:basic membrane protein A